MRTGRLIPELKALAPKGHRRMSANPVANGGLLRKPLDMPDFRNSAVEVKKPGATLAGNVPTLGNFLREVMRQNMQNFRVFGPDETQSNQLQAIYEVGKKVWLGEYFPEDADGGELAPNGRVMEMLSEHTVEGWLEGYILTGRHGLINSYEPFIHVIDSMFNQHAKWLEKCNELPWRAKISSLNLLITAPGMAAGPQRFHAPGSRVSRRGREQESRALCASTCRRMPTLCCPSPTIACGASTTST